MQIESFKKLAQKAKEKRTEEKPSDVSSLLLRQKKEVLRAKLAQAEINHEKAEAEFEAVVLDSNKSDGILEAYNDVLKAESDLKILKDLYNGLFPNE